MRGDLLQYHGEWADGKRDGVGIYTSELGSTYEGEWKEGLRHGEGTGDE